MEQIEHKWFNGDIYEWSLRITPEKWYSFDSIKMDKNEFKMAIIYLIACGEPLIFNNDEDKFKRYKPFDINGFKEKRNKLDELLAESKEVT